MGALNETFGDRNSSSVRTRLAVTLVIALVGSLMPALTAPAQTNGFTDTAGSVHAADIEAIAAAGITKGCNPPANDRYCPDDPVTRGQMASFLVRALDLAAASSDPFTDTSGSVHRADIASLAEEGVTRGCNPPANDRYCPDDPVTRAQMASFLVRALDLSPAPPTTTTTAPTTTTVPTTTTAAPPTTTTTIPACAVDGAFEAIASMPAAVLDPGSTSLDGRMYVVGGKVASDPPPGADHINSLYIYDPSLDQWFKGPDKDGFAVENPAAVAHNGKIYVFGGSRSPFSAFRPEVFAYTPAGANGDLGSWEQLESMPTARAGAVAEVLGGKIYVMGGLTGSSGGTSLTTVEIYDPDKNDWDVGPPLGTARDNAGSAVLGGKIYVFAGRTRVDGVNVEGTLNTSEFLDSGTWKPRASMPTGRRSFIVGTIGGKAQAMGGEDPLITSNQQYDPGTNTWTTLTPMNPGRHGAAFSTIDDVLYIAGGGPASGTSYTDTSVRFTCDGA